MSVRVTDRRPLRGQILRALEGISSRGSSHRHDPTNVDFDVRLGAVAIRERPLLGSPKPSDHLARVGRRVRDLSVHRPTASLFPLAAVPAACGPPFWGRRLAVRILAFAATIAGVTSTAALFGQSASASKPAPAVNSANSGAATPADGAAKSPVGGAKESADNSQENQETDKNVKAIQPAPPEFSIDNPLTTDKKWKDFDQGVGHREFADALHNGELTRDSQKKLSDGIRQMIYAMTLPSMRDPHATVDMVAELVRRTLSDVRKAADTKDATVQRSFRRFLMDEIIARCRELSDNQFHVRLNAAVLLGNLFLTETNILTHTPGEFYNGSNYENFNALMEILQKPGQSEAVKIVAINGLRNAVISGTPALSASHNITLAKALIAELEKPNSEAWYQERLCETLASVDQVFNLDQQPFIVHALAKAMFDRNRSLCARAAAAKALGRAKMVPSVDLNVIAYGIADLSRQLVEARNEGQHVRRWCVVDVLLAFKPKDSAEKSRKAGLLERVSEPSYQSYKKVVNEAYLAIRPMIIQEFKQPNSDFPPAVSASIANWLKSNTPPSSQMRVSPGSPLIVAQQVMTKAESDEKKSDTNP